MDKIDILKQRLLGSEKRNIYSDEISLIDDEVKFRFWDEPIDSIRAKFINLHSSIPRGAALIKLWTWIYWDDYFENRNADIIKAYVFEIQWRIMLAKIQKEFEDNIDDRLSSIWIKLFSGWIKSIDSILRRIKNNNKLNKVRTSDNLKDLRDYIRWKLICDNIAKVDNVIEVLSAIYWNKIISIFNSFHSMRRFWKKWSNIIKPYLWCNISIEIDQNFSYEMQIMTRRAHVIWELNHPVYVGKWIDLAIDLRDYLDRICFWSQVLDMEGFLNNI